MRSLVSFSLRQFLVHWERNENKHAISKAYRMGSILGLAGLELDHRPNPAWLPRVESPSLPQAGHHCHRGQQDQSPTNGHDPIAHRPYCSSSSACSHIAAATKPKAKPASAMTKAATNTPARNITSCNVAHTARHQAGVYGLV